ncbi:efflux RND transporter periplasmic adaptor subunit [bacterium]|nr:efflux RND transporter periplasmic adaptor subunit [bacterium]
MWIDAKTDSMIHNYLFLVSFAIIFTVITFSGCSRHDENGDSSLTSKTKSMAINVSVIEVDLSSMAEYIRLLGETEAEKDVVYSAESAGRLEYLPVDLGSKVVKGQIIARIDYEMLKAQADQANAAYELTQKTYTRLETLLEDELVTQQHIDEAIAQKTQAFAQLQQAEIALKHSEVKSTVNGVVASKYVEEGEYMMPGSPIIRIMDFSNIIVTAQVPETRVSEITQNAKVKVSIDALDEIFPADIDVVLPQADPESRTFTIRVKTPNPDGKILVGMAATLTIIVKEHIDVIVLPQEVIVEQADGRYVFIVDGKYARKVSVELGSSENHSVIVESGVEKGDILIVQGHRELVDGQPINIIE